MEVTGHGSAATTPDRLRAHLGAVSHAPTIAQAFGEADDAVRAMLAALRQYGAADEDLRTVGVEVYSDHERRAPRGTFRASFTVEAVLRDVGTAATALSAAVEAGGDASRVHGVSLDAATITEPMAEAREAAWADATAKARQYAGLAGSSLGAVLRVTELGGHVDGPMPMAHAAAAEVSRSIEPGQRTLRTAVTVRWAVEPE